VFLLGRPWQDAVREARWPLVAGALAFALQVGLAALAYSFGGYGARVVGADPGGSFRSPEVQWNLLSWRSASLSHYAGLLGFAALWWKPPARAASLTLWGLVVAASWWGPQLLLHAHSGWIWRYRYPVAILVAVLGALALERLGRVSRSLMLLCVVACLVPLRSEIALRISGAAFSAATERALETIVELTVRHAREQDGPVLLVAERHGSLMHFLTFAGRKGLNAPVSLETGGSTSPGGSTRREQNLHRYAPPPDQLPRVVAHLDGARSASTTPLTLGPGWRHEAVFAIHPTQPRVWELGLSYRVSGPSDASPSPSPPPR
jgi:hypothetical protein